MRIVCRLLSLLLQNYRVIGDHNQGAILRATVCNFMKLFLKQELAMQFLWTGLGPLRKRNKMSFQDHDIYAVFTSKSLKSINLFLLSAFSCFFKEQVVCFAMQVISGGFIGVGASNFWGCKKFLSKFPQTCLKNFCAANFPKNNEGPGFGVFLCDL